MSSLTPKTLTPKAIGRIAICVALFLAPVMTYSAAYLVYGQIDKVNAKYGQATQTKTATKVGLSRSDSAQIAAAKSPVRRLNNCLPSK